MMDEELDDEYEDNNYVNYFDGTTIPWGWQEVVCSCKSPSFDDRISLEDAQRAQNYANSKLTEISKHDYTDYKVKTPPKDIEHCSNCKKRARWQFMICSRCGEFFDWKFKHHATLGSIWSPNIPKGWAWAKRICWTCINKQDPATDDDRPPKFITAPRGEPQLDLDFEISFD